MGVGGGGVDRGGVGFAVCKGIFRPKSFVCGDDGGGGGGGYGGYGPGASLTSTNSRGRLCIASREYRPSPPNPGLTAFSKRTWLVSAQDDFVWAGADETVSLSDPQRVILFLARSPSFEIMTDNPGNPRPR